MLFIVLVTKGPFTIVNTSIISEADFQDQLVEWKEIFGRHGLRVSLEKMGCFGLGRSTKR